MENKAKSTLEPTKQEGVKLTKKAVSDFLQWSSTRYNDYLGFGTKKQNVDTVFNSLKNGHYTDEKGRTKDENTFTVQCATPTGSNRSQRSWKINGSGEEYTVYCESMTITAKYSKRSITFKSE